MECIKAYNRFSKRKIERSFQFKNKAGYLCINYWAVRKLFFNTNRIMSLVLRINHFPWFFQECHYLNEEVFERVESDLEMLRVMSYEDEYSE